MLNPRKILSALVVIPLLVAPLALGDTKDKKEGEKTQTQAQEKKQNVSTSSGPRSCSAKSSDGKQSCAVSCKDDEDAQCSNTATEASCACM